jgi:superfamily II DNA or RNA helicase
MAELMGVSFASVNRWENGQSRPNSLAWEKILRAEKLGINGLTGEYAASSRANENPRPYSILDEKASNLDFSGDAEAVRSVAEGARLTYGHLFNPTFATEISRIDPLPHQRIAVYDRMLAQDRLRFLLADDAGAGKTIMAGLYIREMLSRRLIKRVLIVPPAGLVGNWHHEMHELFSLPFRVATGSDARETNPFVGPDSDLLIVSVDTLAADRTFSRISESEVEPYDLVIFDEAHKLSAHREPDFTVRKTERYCLAEAISGVPVDKDRWRLGWSAQHLMLLTATPHMGKEYPYYCLWRLLDPEVFSTVDALKSYPKEARKDHFIRRTKEEMVKFSGEPIYPMRVSDTLTYKLTQGKISEQTLYDETTAYLQNFYNQAQILNRTAARFAIGIFQRRLASSTYALLRSLERRDSKLGDLIHQLESGELTEKQLENAQDQLGKRIQDVFEDMTADEEGEADGRELNEKAEEKALAGVAARSIEDLKLERKQVKNLLVLARQVQKAGEESKFSKLREVIENPDHLDEKLIIFTEHKDTLDFLVKRLESIGYTGQIARIHGGMSYPEREEQVEFFRKKTDQGGAQYLVATDAAGEGINLQFCWRMVNYDVPWNPARLEQRMGRIHRYGQKHDPVIIINLVAGETREGRVLETLLKKLEKIRRDLGSDKVFDVVGRTFKGVSIKSYMERLSAGESVESVTSEIDDTLTSGKIKDIEQKERKIYGGTGEVAEELDRLRGELKDEQYVRLLPGYVRRFIENAAPLLDIEIEGDPEEFFSLRPLSSGSLDPLWPVLEGYKPQRRERLTVRKPEPEEECIWLRPGEPFFDRFLEYVQEKFQDHARRGATFIDPSAESPYIFHLALINIFRKADPDTSGLEAPEALESRLVGIKYDEDGQIQECPVEHLLLLKGKDGVPVEYHGFTGESQKSVARARAYATDTISSSLAGQHRKRLQENLTDREESIKRGFNYQEAELATARAELRKKAEDGNTDAAARLEEIKKRQKALDCERDEAINRVRREPELVDAGEVEFLAHALVVPTSDPEERKRHDAEVERIAMQVAMGYEEGLGADVRDVSTPELARAAGLNDWPGFDVLSNRTDQERLAIEVKGRAERGNIELSGNEWAAACNLREDYWLYVVYDCAGSEPKLHRVRDPFGSIIAQAKGGVVIEEEEVLNARNVGKYE